jgi:uncharacterized protein YkwD
MRTLLLWAVLAAAALALPVSASAAAEHTVDPAAVHRAAASAATVQPRSDRWEARVVALTNQRRQAHGRRPLRAAPCPDRYAEPWTRHLATAQVLVHQDLAPMLSCPHTSHAGENIAYGYPTPGALVRAWMHSAGHRANILSRHFHRIGVSGWRATNGTTYATQDFVG